MFDDILALALYCLMALAVLGFSVSIFTIWQLMAGVSVAMIVKLLYPWKRK